MCADDTDRLDRYGEEQTMVRNERGHWIGESGYVYVREQKCSRYANRCLLIGLLIGAGCALLSVLFLMEVPL